MSSRTATNDDIAKAKEHLRNQPADKKGPVNRFETVFSFDSNVWYSSRNFMDIFEVSHTTTHLALAGRKNEMNSHRIWRGRGKVTYFQSLSAVYDGETGTKEATPNKKARILDEEKNRSIQAYLELSKTDGSTDALHQFLKDTKSATEDDLVFNVRYIATDTKDEPETLKMMLTFFSLCVPVGACWDAPTAGQYSTVMKWKHPNLNMNQVQRLFMFPWERDSTTILNILHCPLVCESARPTGQHGKCCRPSHLKYGTSAENSRHTRMAMHIRNSVRAFSQVCGDEITNGKIDSGNTHSDESARDDDCGKIDSGNTHSEKSARDDDYNYDDLDYYDYYGDKAIDHLPFDKLFS